jgi:bidirectional [NiFe] hydrogenase diaphorase subunit
MVEATARRHGREPHALIETLHTVQETFGYLDETALRFVAALLCVPLSRVYGVATFYHFFTLKPKGKHTCVVYTGTACYIKVHRRCSQPSSRHTASSLVRPRTIRDCLS